MRVRRAVVLTGVVAALSALTACGQQASSSGVASVAGTGRAGASASPSPSVSADPAKFARCMREHGIKINESKGGGMVTARVTKGDKTKMEEAHKACGKYIEGAIAERMNDPKTHDAMVKFAACMRENGIDMPDPQPGKGFPALAKPAKRPRGDAAMEKAVKACQDHLPGGRTKRP
ncbi:hypothetical protein [Spongiactinospora gelatinilytica]|uniref:hypothetical protein n=1 Tax=Spongiactinospora gelatinilytica TaxID=2666298 RepID=UPI0011B948D0|nr:hypothetical protein [Spongiactinospora gelatinilytica]